MTQLVAELRTRLKDAGNPVEAKAQQRYMKTEQPMYGIKTDWRRALVVESLKLHPIESAEQFDKVMEELWQAEYRDEHYAALDIAERLKKFQTREQWPRYEQMMRTCDWWDTLDWVAARIMSPIADRERDLLESAADWVKDKSEWVRRAGLLIHLKHKENTDTEALAAAIEAVQHETSFWIRKAIGWVLREYSAVDSQWVKRFVIEHPDLSTLSVREALKHA